MFFHWNDPLTALVADFFMVAFGVARGRAGLALMGLAPPGGGVSDIGFGQPARLCRAFPCGFPGQRCPRRRSTGALDPRLDRRLWGSAPAGRSGPDPAGRTGFVPPAIGEEWGFVAWSSVAVYVPSAPFVSRRGGG
jgi:hypothetical protein